MLKRLRANAIALVVLAASLLALATPASANPAATPAAAYKCGSQCNGHSPSWVIPSNGVQCINSAVLIGSGHPAYSQKTPVDYSVTAHAYYSTVCQTMWATISRTAASTDYTCGYFLDRTVAPTYYYDNGVCPAKGSSNTSPMIDDANGGNVAGTFEIITQWVASDGSKHGGLWSKSY